MSTPLPAGALTPRGPAVLAAVLVFVLGFGILNILSVVGLGDERLPGLYTFRSATVGDAILLPILAYALVRAARWQAEWGRSARWCLVTAAHVGALAGAATQAQWLLHPHPRLNWTLPAVHHFNVPGWYHAAFLTAASGFFAAAATALWLRVRNEAHTMPDWPLLRMRSVGAVGVLVPGPAFAALLAQDNGAGLAPAVGLAAATTLAIVAAVGAAAGLGVLPSAVAAGVVAVPPAAALACLCSARSMVGPGTLLSALVPGLAGASATLLFPLRTSSERAVVAACTALAASGPVYVATTLDRAHPVALATAALVSCTVTAFETALLGGAGRRG